MRNLAWVFGLFIFISGYAQNKVLLNGLWEVGMDRDYRLTAEVPSVNSDPTLMSSSTVWYRKKVRLPEGDWKYATLVLNGARFCPEVYVNKNLVSKAEGGMAPTFHPLKTPEIKPGKEIVLEIALKSMKEVPVTDASYIPVADHWRSNISSYLWDDVYLRFHGKARIDRVIPFTDLKNNSLKVKYSLTQLEEKAIKEITVQCELTDLDGKVIQQATALLKPAPAHAVNGEIILQLNSGIKKWSPLQPNLYRIRLSLLEKGKMLDFQEISYGVKEFRVNNKQFELNNSPFKARAATVVWHRWTRDPEGKELAYDTAWFRKNIIQALKDRGANTLRFHLGTPPERFLDMCDKYGLLVQYEWHFFHGMTASAQSLQQQWKNWLDLAMRHPSVSIIHPYNETEGPELKTVWDVLDKLAPEYPSMVISERDVLHIHKYWWSLFENTGVYYDDASQFPMAIMVDEFGGNYLDGQGNLGGYKTLKESYLRFLGRNHTREMRLYHHTISNSLIAEYWRRIDAAGFSPFCALGSPEDGNHWFLDNLKTGTPKPVWNALTAAWSPVSVSIDVWDRHFTPGQMADLPVFAFNDLEQEHTAVIEISIKDSLGNIVFTNTFNEHLKPFSKSVVLKTLSIPHKPGKYTFQAKLLNPPPYIKYPVVSEWDFNVFSALASFNQQFSVAIPNNEDEISEFVKSVGLIPVAANDITARTIVCSHKTWQKIAMGDTAVLKWINTAIDKGISVIMLDAGPMNFGQGYPKNKGELGPLKGASVLANPATVYYPLIKGLKVGFKEAAEPESHIHRSLASNLLWENLSPDDTWLFNGLRGGLILPAAELELSGITRDAFEKLWSSRGLKERPYAEKPFFAYQLQGFFEFSKRPADKEAEKKLRDRVRFLVNDAPALAASLSPDAPLVVTNLYDEYVKTAGAEALAIIPLVSAGKNLMRFPVYQIDFGPRKGKLIISQMITSGRLAPGFGTSDKYGIRYDEVARQW